VIEVNCHNTAKSVAWQGAVSSCVATGEPFQEGH